MDYETVTESERDPVSKHQSGLTCGTGRLNLSLETKNSGANGGGEIQGKIFLLFSSVGAQSAKRDNTMTNDNAFTHQITSTIQYKYSR